MKAGAPSTSLLLAANLAAINAVVRDRNMVLKWGPSL
jgi:hypothetical protein